MSYTGRTVSYKAIMDKQIRDWGFEIDDEQGIEWLAEFMALTKVGMVMEEVTRYIPICDGRGDLPTDLYKVVQTARLCDVASIEDAECGGGTIVPMRWKTDHFHDRYHKDSRDYTSESAETYTVNNNCIFTSFDVGFVAMAIEAIPTDKDGAPLIPSDQSWLEAAAHDLAWKFSRKLRRTGSIDPNFYAEIQRDRDWYFAQAVNAAKLDRNVDQAQSAQNANLRTIPDVNAHGSFFANMQIPEQRYFRGRTNTGNSNEVNTTQSKDNLQ